MQGPLEEGHRLDRLDAGFRILARGLEYEVLRSFSDMDGDIHPCGERWVFLGSLEQASGDGFSLFVGFGGKGVFIIRLLDEQGYQAGVLGDLEGYFGRGDRGGSPSHEYLGEDPGGWYPG